jgi:Leucine-rich repeat (LRR) protein
LCDAHIYLIQLSRLVALKDFNGNMPSVLLAREIVIYRENMKVTIEVLKRLAPGIHQPQGENAWTAEVLRNRLIGLKHSEPNDRSAQELLNVYRRRRDLIDCLRGLTFLTSIDLKEKGLKYLLPELSFLPSLNSLDVSGNELTSVPQDLLNKENCRINLSHNRIEEIPIADESVEKLNLTGNPLKPISRVTYLIPTGRELAIHALCMALLGFICFVSGIPALTTSLAIAASLFLHALVICLSYRRYENLLAPYYKRPIA